MPAGSRAPVSNPPATPSPPRAAHLDPTMFVGLALHVLPLTVEEGIANGVAEVRKAVRYQIKYGAKLNQGARLREGEMSRNIAAVAPVSGPATCSAPRERRRRVRLQACRAAAASRPA